MPKPKELAAKREKFDILHKELFNKSNLEYRFDPADSSASDCDEIGLFIGDQYLRIKEDGTYEVD